MGSPIREHISELLLSNKRHARYAAILACLALVVAVGVAGLLRQRGNAMTHEETVLDCQYSGTGAHMHNADCYDADGDLVCPLEERELHVHDDSCYEETSRLVCGLEESEGHAHDDSCYDDEGNLVCELEESEGHTHDDSCYETERELVCDEEEITEEHVHGPGCFTTVVVEDDEAEDEAEASDSMPAQTFEAHTNEKQPDDIYVYVEAPEGAFPADTTMKVKLVDKSDVEGAIDEAVAEHTDAKVVDIQTVDITFRNAEGEEIEPATEIMVQVTSNLIRDNEKPLIVHVDNDGRGEVIDTLDEEQLAERDLEKTDNQLTFDAAEFSSYSIVITSIEQTLTAKDGHSYKVTVDCPESAGIPQGAELVVDEIAEGSEEYDTYLQQTNEAIEGEASFARFFDITIAYNGEPVQPAEPVDVKIKLADGADLSDNVRAVHFAEGGPEVLEASLDGKTVAFQADGFSVYAVVDENTDDKARMTVEFYGNDHNNPIATMYVKNGDTAEEVEIILYDPGVGTLGSGEIFNGWLLDNPDYTTADASSAWTIDQIREWAVNKSITEGDEHKFYAAICKLYTITYKDDDGTVLGLDAIPVKSSDYGTAAVDYTVRMAYTPKDDMHHFEGWILDEDSVSHVASTVPADRTYSNDSSISIKGDVSFTVNAPQGNWLVFDENGKGGTYNAPAFYKANETTAAPCPDNEMTRNGYTFGGWYDTKEHADAHGANPSTTTGKFTFGSTLSQKTTLYASWIPATTAPYTVVLWGQNIDRTAYEVKGTYVGTGAVGQAIPYRVVENGDEDYVTGVGANNGHYTGFSIKDADKNQSVTITPEGDAVLNLHYDRITYNMRIYLYRKGSGNNSYQYAQNSNRGKNVWNIATWYSGTGQSSMPTTTYGPIYSELNDGYTGYYILLSAYYGEDISSKWPRYDQISSPANNRSPVSFIMMNGAGLKGNGLNDNGYGTGKDTIKGLITTMDEKILGKTNDANGNYLIVRFNTYNSWRYHIWYETVSGEDYTGKTTRTYNGKTYYEADVIESRSSNTDVAQQNPPQYTGYEYLTRRNQNWSNDTSWTTNNPTLHHVNYVYNRLQYKIDFFDGTYVDGNENIIQNRATHHLHESDPISHGALIPVTDSNYTPSLPEGEDGYVFEGWYLDEACTTPYTWDKMPIGGIKVYAKWRQVEYRVFLHPNAGTDPNLDWGSETVSTSFRVSYGGKVSTPTGKRAESGYEFVGWYTDPSCSSEYLYNPDTELNDDTVTAAYDQTEDTELDQWGNVKSGQEGVNSDSKANRTWITRKLDLYAKWRKVLEGAEGIKVIYTADDGKGHTGTNAPTDSTYYPDQAEATAQAADTAPEGMFFKCWVVQRWDEDQQEYVDTDTTVLPGEKFVVKEELARKQPGTEGNTYTYTMQLRAEYTSIDEELPTHIWWFNNYGPDSDGRHDSIHRNEGIKINEAVNILSAPTREGYAFLGWARVDSLTSKSAVGVPAGSAPTGLVLEDLDEDDLYLKYENDSFTLVDSTSEHNGKTVTKVAADERHPYHDMYAVWKRQMGYLKIGKHFDVQEFYLDGVDLEARWHTLNFWIKDANGDYVKVAKETEGPNAGNFIYVETIPRADVENGTVAKPTISLADFIRETGSTNEHQYFAYAWLPYGYYTVHEDENQADNLLSGYTRQEAPYTSSATVAAGEYGNINGPIGSGDADRINNNYRGDNNYAYINVNKVIAGNVSVSSTKKFYFIVKNNDLNAFVSTRDRQFTTVVDRIAVFSVTPDGELRNASGNVIESKSIQVIGDNSYSIIELDDDTIPHAIESPVVEGIIPEMSVSPSEVTPVKNQPSAVTITNTYTRPSVDVYLNKVETGKTALLPGAEFKLLRKNAAGEYAVDEAINWTKAATTLSLTDGSLELTALPEGDYKLTETKAPSGYLILTKDIYFTVQVSDDENTSVVVATTGQESFADVGASVKQTTKKDDTLVITNTPGDELPMTGGPGTNLFTITGTALIVGALMYGSVSRRRNERRSMG